MDWVGEDGWSDDDFFTEIMSADKTDDEEMLAELAAYLKALYKALEIVKLNSR